MLFGPLEFIFWHFRVNRLLSTGKITGNLGNHLGYDTYELSNESLNVNGFNFFNYRLHGLSRIEGVAESADSRQSE